MPSDLSYWIISAPLKDGDPSLMLEDVRQRLPGVVVGGWEIPELKAGTLSSLLTLSDTLPKTDSTFTTTVSKTLDTIRTLLNDPSQLSQHARVNDRPAEEFVIPSAAGGAGYWRWDRGRWGEGRKVGEVLEDLAREMSSIDAQQKQRTGDYNLIKGQLTNLQRKRVGNLSQRSLVDVVKKGDLVEDSEFMETLLVAVPKNLQKDWANKYERLTGMVVPRSTQKLAEDDEFVLQTVTVFKKVRDEFVHKARENKFIVRDFKWDDSALEKQQKDIAELASQEKELWAELLKLSRINFSEAYQILAHLKTIRLFVESVLRYGLPADYAGIVVRPDPKTAEKTLRTLSGKFNYLASASRGPATRRGKTGGATAGGDEVGGEWAGVMEAEYFDFVLFELPKVLV
ncbi:Vacuolar ATP synthase subunit C [Saitozyma podzolica]|uniref:V-type proton ATPase subunit C n=1 Tax=Saitozyma podzolica TaxID=1890683 RepID=A0A427YUJ5_9TREE|nr:Vacuolar ATP synthase subunit C [Saitozyma podzolica]